MLLFSWSKKSMSTACSYYICTYSNHFTTWLYIAANLPTAKLVENHEQGNTKSICVGDCIEGAGEIFLFWGSFLADMPSADDHGATSSTALLLCRLQADFSNIKHKESIIGPCFHETRKNGNYHQT